MSEKKVARRACQYCVALITCLLVVIAICAPLYAFTAVSCTSTRTCQIGSILSMANAECTEGPGERSSMLMSGEVCTVKCFSDKVPNTAVLRCLDGMAAGAKGLKCEDPPPPRAGLPTAGGLVRNAITGGELRTACERAANLVCIGAPGGTAILLQLQNLTRKVCQELMDECRDINDEFQWMQHTGGAPSPAGAPPLGECSLGCFNEIPDRDLSTTTPTPAPPALLGSDPPGTARYCGGDPGPEAPICIAVSGSCNVDDNGDYYRYEACADNQAQWVQVDQTHRIRYDGQPQFSQGGKWLLEMDADPTLSVFGTPLARQNTFGIYPELGRFAWNLQCRYRINSFTFQITYRTLPLNLGPCTCTRLQDCSNNGVAVGDKKEGPNCECECDPGWTGDHCEIPLCKVPDIVRAKIPACREGAWILPGGKCTPACESGYNTVTEFLTCAADGSEFVPIIFVCKKSLITNNLQELARAQYLGTTTELPPCTEFECSWRGTPTGERREDGTCICECFENYIGNNCLTYASLCPAPFDIPNAAPNPCKEGTVVTSVCTAQCAQGFWPVPTELKCAPGNTLFPPTFDCFGGPSIRTMWCDAMKYTAIGCSVAATLALLFICIHQVKPQGRKTSPFMVMDERVDIDKDEHGNYNVVHMEQKDKRSYLPERLVGQTVQEATPLRLKDLKEPALALQDVHSPPRLALQEEYPGTEISIETTGEPRRQRGASLLAVDVDVGAPDKDAAQDMIHTLLPEDLLRLGAASGDPHAAAMALALGDLPTDANEFALALPGTLPEEPKPVHNDWLMQYRQLDHEAQVNRYEETRNAANEKLSEEQRAAIAREASIQAAVKATVQERADAEAKMNQAMAAGDAEALREGVEQAKALLQKCAGAAASVTNPLDRLVKISVGRIQQYDERESARQRREAWKSRVRAGIAADWKMTVPELWVHCENANLGPVKAGMKAKLPVLNRSSDGKRLTVLHIALRPACVEERAEPTAGADATVFAEDKEDLRVRRLAVIEELLKAKASPNAVDFSDRTPLDLAVCEGGEGAESLTIVQALRKLGFLTAKEAAAEARAEAEAKAEAEKLARLGARPMPTNSPARPN